jgi:plastocyanin
MITLVVLLTALLVRSVNAKSPSDATYNTIVVKNGGTVSGVILFEGDAPAVSSVEVTKDRKVCGKDKPSETLLVDPKTMGIQNAVVYLSAVTSGKEWNATEELAMDQKGCVFTPHVLVVPVGQTFMMLNNDGILHNIHTRSERNKEINKAQPKFLKKMKLTFKKPEFVKVACDVHNWMTGWVVAADNPYYEVTNEKGRFEISNIPAASRRVYPEDLA